MALIAGGTACARDVTGMRGVTADRTRTRRGLTGLWLARVWRNRRGRDVPIADSGSRGED